MEIVKVLFLTAAAAFLGELLRQYAPAYAPLYAVGVCACLVGWLAILYAGPLRSFGERLAAAPGGTGSAILLKAVAIGILSELVQDVCEDAGQKALAGKAALAGKLAVLAAALPLFEEVLGLLTELLL